MFIRSRWVHVTTVLAAALGMTVLAVVTNASHEQDEPPATPKGIVAGPARGTSVAMPRGLIGLSITLGLKDEQRTPWDGEVTVSEGRVLGLDLVQGTLDSSTDGSKFKVATKKKGAANKKKKAAAKAAGATLPAVLHVNLDAPEAATVTVRSAQGTFSFQPAELSRTGRKLFLDDRAAVERQDAAVRLTGAGTEDDFPSAARALDGTVWLAYVEYRPEVPHLTKAASKKEFDTLVPTKNGDRVRLRSFDGTTWSPGLDVTGGGLDVWRPTVAVDGQGKVWVAWAQQIEGDWEILTRIYTPPTGAAPGSWTEPRRITNAKGSDFHVVAATDSKGHVWLAWQAFRRDNYEILATTDTAMAQFPFPEPLVVSSSPADDWGPAIVADGQGGVFVAWDTYDKGNFDVMIRDVGRAGPPVAVAVVVAVRGAAEPGGRQGEPGLDRLRGRRRAVGQGLRPRRERHERRAGEEPGVRPLRPPDDQAEVPRRRQADGPCGRRRAEIRPDRRPEQERPPARLRGGRDALDADPAPPLARRGGRGLGRLGPGIQRRELVGAEEADQFGQPDRQPPGPGAPG